MADQLFKPCDRSSRNPDSKKATGSCSTQGSYRKQSRKGQNPTRFTPAPSQSLSTRVCTNSECKAVLSMEDSFCRSCSCWLCHQFDKNQKDPSLWLVCESDNGSQGYSCGLACHIECAFQHQKVGVVDHGPYRKLDGHYWCSPCGNVFGILGCWKKQLRMAADARCVNVLCQRIFLSYRLLSGTSRFKALHEIVEEAKMKLEEEVGPINQISHLIGRGAVSRLCVAAAVQKLLFEAISMADDWALYSTGSTPIVCTLQFEDLTSSSVAVALIKIPTALTEKIKGFKVWYWRAQLDSCPDKPSLSLSREHRRTEVEGLQSSTEYTFRVVPYTSVGDLGISEASCLTTTNPNESSPTAVSVPLELDLNVPMMPDLNEDAAPESESEIESESSNGYALEVPVGDAKTGAMVSRKRSFEETFDYDSALPNFDECVEMIRRLEDSGHIDEDFRKNFLTWFGLRSTEQERHVVESFIRTLSDEPEILVGQLVNAFADVIGIKKTRD